MALKKRATWLCAAEKYTHRSDQLFYVQRNKGTVRIKGQAANDIGE
jgi:hypothetical protein